MEANGLLLTLLITNLANVTKAFRPKVLVMTRGNQRDLAREKSQKKQQVMTYDLSLLQNERAYDALSESAVGFES